MVYIDNIFTEYPDIVSLDEMRKMLHIGRNKALQLLAEKKIQSIRIGNRHKIPKISVIEFLNRDSGDKN